MGGTLRCYVHVATGNYNSKTAQLYTDLGLFTCREDVCEDIVDLFAFLTGRSLKRDYRKLLVAPLTMRSRFIAMIEREAELARAGKSGRIIAKMNALEDVEVIQALYKASQAGVKIDLIVRGFCCLRPGMPGVSENIRDHVRHHRPASSTIPASSTSKTTVRKKCSWAPPIG